MSVDVKQVKEIIDDHAVDQKSFDNFLSKMNMTASDFISYTFDISSESDLSGSMLKGQWSPVLFSLYKNNVNLNKILLPYITMDTILGNIKNKNTLSGYSKITTENILFSGNFYNNFPTDSTTQFLASINNLHSDLEKLKSQKTQYLGVLKSKNFIDYVLPVLLKNNANSIIESIIFPLLHNYVSTTEKIMQYGNVEHIKLWLKLSENNKNTFINIVNKNPAYSEAKGILALIDHNEEHKEILLDMLTPETIFKMLISSNKDSEDKNIDKMRFILSQFPVNVKDNFVESFYFNSKNLNPDNTESVFVNKNTPVAYAILKNMDKTLDYFLSLGYVLNTTERGFLSGKKHSDESVDAYEKIVSIVSSTGKKATKKLEDFFFSLSESQKASVLSKLYNISLEKETDINGFYSLKETKKKLKEESTKVSLSMRSILNCEKDILITLLNHGYKLTQKEYSLTYLFFSRWLENITAKEESPLEKNFKIADFLKDYPVEYKRDLLLNVLKSLFHKSIKVNDVSLELNDLLPVVNYLLKDEFITFSDKEISPLLSMKNFAKLSENNLYPLASTLLNNTNISQKIDNKSEFLSSVLLSNNFNETHRNGKNQYEIKIIQGLLSMYENSVSENVYFKFKEKLLARNLSTKVLNFLEQIMIENEKENIEKSLLTNENFNKKIRTRI